MLFGQKRSASSEIVFTTNTSLSDELKQTILNHLRLSWSPEMIAHEFKLATKSIYNWLNQGKLISSSMIYLNMA